MHKYIVVYYATFNGYYYKTTRETEAAKQRNKIFGIGFFFRTELLENDDYAIVQRQRVSSIL